MGSPAGSRSRSLAYLSGRLRHQLPQAGNVPLGVGEGQTFLSQREAGPGGAPPAYKLICLLDEAGKLLERVLANRLIQYLSREGMDFHRDQHGFRGRLSTVDAILRVRSLAESIMEESRVVLAVSLDIRNAFNTLPWSV